MSDNFDALRENLITAREKYTGDASVGDRVAAAEALRAVVVFLKAECDAGNLEVENTVPLSALAYALDDFDTGRQHSLLIPPGRHSGRPRKAFILLAHLATASAGITFLMEKNHNEEDASHVVSRLLEKNNLPTLEGGGHSPSKKLTAWRDKLNGGTHGEDANKIYRSSLNAFRRHLQENPKDTAEEIINSVFAGFSKNH